jgi:hypothetical protein
LSSLSLVSPGFQMLFRFTLLLSWEIASAMGHWLPF